MRNFTILALISCLGVLSELRLLGSLFVGIIFLFREGRAGPGARGQRIARLPLVSGRVGMLVVRAGGVRRVGRGM